MSLNHLLNSATTVKINNSTVYTNENTSDLDFVHTLTLPFSLKRQGNFIYNKNKSTQCILNLNLIYQWTTSDFAVDFQVNILVDNIIVYNFMTGLSNYPHHVNKLCDSCIIDITSNSTVSFQLTKINSDDVNKFRFMKNSFFTVQLL